MIEGSNICHWCESTAAAQTCEVGRTRLTRHPRGPEGLSLMNTATKRDPNRRPTHPGEILREDALPALDMSQTEFAKLLDVSRSLSRSCCSRSVRSPPIWPCASRRCSRNSK